MPAVLHVETIDNDDDDGFDWEAAVREIDVACPLPSSFTSHPPPESSLRNAFCNATSVNYTTNKPPTCRQSTLDQFVVKTCPIPSLEANEDVRDSNIDKAYQSTASCLHIDPDAAKTWIYPVNIPLRDYQFSITKTALFSNTLVALPTGLGKTLIAAVVMYNFFRWFPEGKIVFTAPSRPLVMQQIEACHNIVGMPLEWTIDMTGQISPRRRACLWKSKRVFFVTPQVLEKDIQSGKCMTKNLVCLVIDEAHRAMGNYSYSVAVRELMATPLQLRILALSATPGSNQQTIQQVIDNLHISTLEYRNESDHDVSPYVHKRKLELIVVPMGQDAIEINNLLSEVIHPFVTRLSAFGVLQYLDFQNLSPCALLNSREKFRQAWPPDLPHPKSSEVEGYFGALITLYHMRKLLSSDGIGPAYKLLEEKSKGPFARHTSRNEGIHKVKLLMQKSLSHGAPSPKMSKLTDILVDHFKRNSQSSRVIIFANFRGSVRDIINAIEGVGEYVKATEFIGQSSGKVLRGQTQKVQQAVLEKFRAGVYNVIVATSIGEEGLDIMEVDLVICFDANISSLRMIQRMGRTGRKNDGRVVVLSCEGFELKGYMRKQAKSKALGKHMQNGGVNSFRFHSSPRMIPHVFKPEVQLVELSIEQFVRHGRKVTDEHFNQTHIFSEKLTDGEIEAVAKYFHSNRETKLRLSLIAFPHFQSFPSGVHQVMHSFRTGILINSMQHLQEITISKGIKTPVVEDGDSANQCAEIEIVELHASKQLKSLSEGSFDSLINENNTKQNLQTTDEQNMQSQNCQNVPTHSYLFGSDFVSVDVLGKVQIISVPFLALEENSKIKSASKSMSLLLNHKQVYSHSEVLTGDFKPLTLKEKDVAEFTVGSQAICTKSKNTISSLCNSNGQQKTLLDRDVRNPNSSHIKIHTSNQAKILEPTENDLENKSQIQLVETIGDDFRDPQLSPRLTNFIESGVVPESPLGSGDSSDGAVKDYSHGLDVFSHAKLLHELREKTSGPIKIELAVVDRMGCGKGDSESLNKVYFHGPVATVDSLTREVSGSPFLTCKKIQNPLDNLSNNSCCNDWRLSSGEKSDSVEQRDRFKRLRKFKESCKKSTKCIEHNALEQTEGLSRSSPNSSFIPKMQCRGKRKEVNAVRAYVEDEAEVSSESFESDDEEGEDCDSFDESFIDDRLNPTAASTHGGIDMMAIYRRSLLSQSPIENFPNCSMVITPVSVASGSACSSGKNVFSLLAPQSAESMPRKIVYSQKENDFRMENQKGKRTFPQTGNLPIISLDKKFVENIDKESSMQCQVVTTEENETLFYDDLFYESIDLDAVEAQASNFLKSKTDLSIQKQKKRLKPTQSVGLIGSPSFDLGI